MKKKRLFWIALALPTMAVPLAAQQPTRQDSILIQLRQLLRRVDSLEQLVNKLRQGGRDTTGPTNDLAALRAAAQAAVEAAPAPADSAPQTSRTRNLSALTPGVVTGDVVGKHYTAQDAETDYPLSRVIARVVRENPDVRAAERAYAAARGRLLTQRPPLADPVFGVDYEGLSKPLGVSGFAERTLGISQSIEFPLKWWKRNEIMGNEARVTEMDFEMVKLVRATDARRGYGEVLARQRDEVLADDNLALAEDFLQKAEVRFQAGDVRRIEVLRAGIEVARAELDTMTAGKDVLLAKTALNLLMARDAHAPLNLTDELTFAPVDYDMESLKALMMERHPLARAWDYAVAGGRSAASLAALQFVPDFEVGISRQTIQGEGSFWTAGFGFEIPLWFLFRQRGDLQEAQANLGQVQAEQVSALNDLVLELEGAFHQLQVADRQVRIYVENLIGEAEEVYRIASRSYEEGETSYLEVLEAQRILRTTRTEYTQALFEYEAALADMEQAVGGAPIPVNR